MRFALFVLISLLLPASAFAGQAEAKDLARSYNCQVSGISLVGQETGPDGASIYEAICSLPAQASEEDKKANGKLLIACSGGLCSLTKKGE